MIKPNSLKKGDTIALIAPASPTTCEKLNSAINSLEKLGLNVEVGESCRKKHGFLSGSDEIRAYDINNSFENKQIKGVFALRGGYGSARLLDLIDYNVIRNNPKIFIGYSDITALHIAFNQRCNLITYHGPMPSTELNGDMDDYTMNIYKNSIFKQEPLNIKAGDNNNMMKSLYPGSASGILTGGNLTVICSLLGTKYEIDTFNKILFIEEIGEEPYKVDRMLTQLRQCNKFDHIQGILLGKFINCNASNESRSLSIEEVIKENLLKLKKPIIYNVQCGHCLPTLTLPLGSNVYLDANNTSIITF